MFAGHLSAGLLLKRADRSISLAALFAAAMFPDLLLWVLVLFNIERLDPRPTSPVLISDIHYDFPYSHGLVASLAWAISIAAIARILSRSARAALVIGLAVLSHFTLDWLVHSPEPPVLGAGSPLIGAGLWQHPLAASVVEGALAVFGVWMYLSTVRLSRAKTVALLVLMSAVTFFSLAGLFRPMAVPESSVLAATSIAMILFLIAVGLWLDSGKEAQ